MEMWPDIWFGPINLWNAPKSAGKERMTIIVYSKPACPQCDTLKKQLDQAFIKYEVIDVSVDTEARHFLLNEGHRSVPQLYQDGRLVKTLSELHLD
jgi:glutaredoxin-like protein NrdH